jgi:hypothetical protein
MTGMKLRRNLTPTGAKVQYEPIQISIDLTPEQAAVISRVTGKLTSKLELTASDLKNVIRSPFTAVEWEMK